MIFASIAEVFSIGAVFPFLGVLTSPQSVFNYPAAQSAIRFFDLTRPDQLLLPLTIVFGAATLFAGAMRLLLLWVQTRLAFATGSDLGISIYRRTLYQPYAVHVSRNSSEIVNGVYGKASGISNATILPVVTLISTTMLLVSILLALLAVNPVTALSGIGGLGFVYAIIIKLTHKRLYSNGQLVATESGHVIKSLQEGLGGIRDVLIDGTQDTYCRIYQDADQSLRRAQVSNTFIAQSPRFAMEAFGMLFIAVMAYGLAKQADGIATAIPILGALALGAQRLLPVLQQGFQAWSSIRGSQASLDDTLKLLDQPLPEYADKPVEKALPFATEIRLRQVCFRYTPDTDLILKNIELCIPKGSRVGFIGATGGGKSTLLDIIMGLLSPIGGRMEIDGTPITSKNYRAWQAHIAHVPQAIFLSDSSIEENIAFGIPPDQIDHARVRNAAAQAQIADTIETWPKKYKTVVGERGVRLSGGQRQRIGIARALYKQADVIIFDEATSALDSETERAVMEAIEGLDQDLTILIIAHRINTLKDCNLIVELKNGVIRRAGSNELFT